MNVRTPICAVSEKLKKEKKVENTLGKVENAGGEEISTAESVGKNNNFLNQIFIFIFYCFSMFQFALLRAALWLLPVAVYFDVHTRIYKVETMPQGRPSLWMSLKVLNSL